jgi:hypothetical protein
LTNTHHSQHHHARLEEKDPTDPSTTSLAYDFMTPKWAKIQTLLDGTEAMRAAGLDYLYQHEEETDTAYRERLARTVLYNQTEITLDSMVGRPFSDPVKKIDMPPQVEEWLEDVDMQGNNLDVFCRNWFRAGLAKAFSHVLVEFPRPREPEDGRPRTLEDDRRENLHPYWVEVLPENLIYAHAEVVDGREVLTHVRIQENVIEQVGFTERVVQRIRVFEPGMVSVYELRKSRKRKDEWFIVERYAIDLPFVPLVTFYADRQGLMLGKPPMEDLADLNISHWQSQSDQTNVLTVARFPMLAASGISDTNALTVGPNITLSTTDAQGKFYYVEHKGQAIAAGRQDLLDHEERMAEYGAQFLRRRPGSLTATARALDSAEATSPLQDMVTRFEDAVNTALAYTAAWARLESAGAVQISGDFGPETVDGADLQALQAARKNKDISRAKYLKELHRRGTLDDEFDFEENESELEEEASAFPTGEATFDIDPAAADEVEEEMAE